jgi:hypothetical protein
MIIRMEKEEEKADSGSIREAREQAVGALVKYLETYRPTGRQSDSKHSLMGPAGKLLSRITTTNEINWGALKGYILSIHKNLQAPRGVSADAADRLDDVVAALENLSGLLPPTKWLKAVEDIDDEVFFGAFRVKLVEQRKGIQKVFQEWLKGRFKSVDELNALLEVSEDVQEYGDFSDVEDPFSTPSDLDDIVKEFWDERKKKKED